MHTALAFFICVTFAGCPYFPACLNLPIKLPRQSSLEQAPIPAVTRHKTLNGRQRAEQFLLRSMIVADIAAFSHPRQHGNAVPELWSGPGINGLSNVIRRENAGFATTSRPGTRVNAAATIGPVGDIAEDIDALIQHRGRQVECCFNGVPRQVR
ncbi:hypothetical protein JFU58_23150 [Pseudomonas sp. TH34]|uniref:hypothetical protein n=1 Tax=Pseudomonas sp. TH34 TaxID=2796399 RepID=UPI001913A086|nr:hypothetical protein [Pseudomonas sp. TH34]MBK5411425.1 hypothetical protein [Pseudomonas sp. TH34]